MAQAKTLLAISLSTDVSGTLQAAQVPAFTGDVTTVAGALATTIANNAVTNAKAAQMPANTIKGNNTVATANAADLTASQVRTVLGLATTDSPTFAGLTLDGTSADFFVTDATVNTTNATATTLATIATTANTVMFVEAWVTAIRTGGTAGAVNDCATYIRRARIKNNGGTVTVTVAAELTSEDQAGWDATFVVSGTNVNLSVTGALNNNVTWKCVLRRMA